MRLSNVIAEHIVRKISGSFLDSNNVLWKIIDGEWVGKRSVWSIYNTACWLEDIEKTDVKSWWCDGTRADYYEKFYRK